MRPTRCGSTAARTRSSSRPTRRSRAVSSTAAISTRRNPRPNSNGSSSGSRRPTCSPNCWGGRGLCKRSRRRRTCRSPRSPFTGSSGTERHRSWERVGRTRWTETSPPGGSTLPRPSSTGRMRSPGATVLKLVALDMDGTLVDVDSSFAAVHHHFGDHNADGLRDFLAGRIDDREFIRTDVRIWQRHAPDLRIDDLEAILDRVPIMPGAATLISGLRGRGVRTAIVSGGVDLLAHRIARELGIDLALANGFRVDPDGRLTGEGIIRV